MFQTTNQKFEHDIPLPSSRKYSTAPASRARPNSWRPSPPAAVRNGPQGCRHPPGRPGGENGGRVGTASPKMVGKWWENDENDGKWCAMWNIFVGESTPYFFAKHIPKNILETPGTPQYSWRIIIAIQDSVRSVICFMLKHTSSRLSLGKQKTTIFPGSTPPRSSTWRLHGVVHALSEEVQEATRLHPWHQWW